MSDEMAIADVTLPAELVRGANTVLMVHAAEFGIEYCWVREAGSGEAFAVLVNADEFRRLKAAAGEPIGGTA